MRTEVRRSQILRLLERRPFMPFELNIENGDRIVVEHPENLAMSPEKAVEQFANRVHVIGGDVLIYTTLDAISTVAEINEGQRLGDTNGK